MAILEGLARTPWERFEADPEKYGSAERFLQVAVEILDDLGAHLVARSGAGPVERYRDVPARLVGSATSSIAMMTTPTTLSGCVSRMVQDGY